MADDAGSGSSSTDQAQNQRTAQKNKSKLTPFSKVWSDEDEVSILTGIIKFRKEKGLDIQTNMFAFYNYIIDSLMLRATLTQLREKVRALRKKYEKNVSGKKSPKTPHEVELFQLSQKIWMVNAKESEHQKEFVGGKSETPNTSEPRQPVKKNLLENWLSQQHIPEIEQPIQEIIPKIGLGSQNLLALLRRIAEDVELVANAMSRSQRQVDGERLDLYFLSTDLLVKFGRVVKEIKAKPEMRHSSELLEQEILKAYLEAKIEHAQLVSNAYNTFIQADVAVAAPTKPMKKGKREAENEIEKLVSTKKQKKHLAAAQAAEKQKSDAKAQKKKKKQETSSCDDSSQPEDEKLTETLTPPKKVTLAKNGKLASRSDDSDSSGEDEAPSKKAVATSSKNGVAAKKNDDSSDDSSSEEDSSSEAKKPPANVSAAASKKDESSDESSSEDDSSSSDEEEDVVKKAPATASKKEESSDESSDDDDDEPPSKVVSQPTKAPQAVKKNSDSSEETDSDEDDSNSDKGKAAAVCKKKVPSSAGGDDESRDDTSEESDEEEPQKKKIKPSSTPAVSKKESSSEESSDEDESSEEEEDEKPSRTPKK
ncbi:nucleolin 2-like isoform X4 [Nicotiana tomentosiformis]|uniref:nucleolin 2-like isoform X4 n=1 Tax=Nicotiana tomentosiformis TaxID=4098 RepID=UPI00388C6564